MGKFDPVIYVPNDGLITPEIGMWAIKKYQLMGKYCDIFTTGMKNNWEQLVYIDLFAGGGHALLKNDGHILKTSSLIAASLPNKFTKYVVCEQDPKLMAALQTRFDREGQLNVEFIEGDSNKNIEYIISKIPNQSNALRFCFVDPFSLNLEFETIRKVASIGRVDFLILMALSMDGKRNFHNYINDESTKIDKFIGSTSWRQPFKEGKIPQKDFVRFLADYYDQNMAALGYVVNRHLKYQVKTHDSNVPLYYLAFYSKNEKGNDFYEKVEKYQTTQLKMF